MSDEDKGELARELAEKVKNPNLDHTETTRTASEITLKLKCQSCDHVQDFPFCDGQQMEYIEETKEMKCEICSKTEPVAQHHDQPMVPFIMGA